MARTTLIVLFIASLCFIGESAPVTPGLINGLVKSSRGQATGTLNSVIGRAQGELNKDATLTPAQRKCIAVSASSGRVSGQEQLAQVSQQLLVEYQTVPQATTVSQIRADINLQMSQAVEAVVKQTISKMQSC